MNIVITGGNRGIGLELVKIYQDRGDQVYVICRQSNEDLKRLGAQVVDEVDLTCPDVIRTINKRLSHIKIDLLINNAGVFENETLEDLNFESIQTQLTINTIAPLQICDALLPLIKHGGKIAFISSRMGSIADNNSGGYYGYRMSKAALNAAAKSLAIDLKSKEITISILHPGYVKTKMTNYNGDITPDEAAKGLYKQIEKLNLENSGSFWHSNGEKLTW